MAVEVEEAVEDELAEVVRMLVVMTEDRMVEELAEEVWRICSHTQQIVREPDAAGDVSISFREKDTRGKG